MERKLWILPMLLGVTFAQFDRFGGEELTTVDPTTLPGNFLLVGPNTIRPDQPYAVSANILSSRDTDHVLRLEIRNSRNDTKALKLTANMQRGTPQTIVVSEKLDAKQLVPGEYNLYAKLETLGGQVMFEGTQLLTYNAKSLSIFVQTDKAAYKPGGIVRLRSVAIKPNMLPYKGTVSIYVYDPQSNLIQQWTNQTLTKGVSTQEMPLSEDPPLGDWNIKVQAANGMGYEKTFSVEKYVLPKFEVTVQPPSFVTFDDDIEVLVKAKYTYGKGVQGPVTLLVEPAYPFYERPDMFLVRPGMPAQAPLKQITKTAKLNNNGEYSFTVTRSELETNKVVEKLEEWTTTQQIKFTAKVVESLTGIERNGTKELTAHRDEFKIEMEKSTETYKPGLDYKIMLNVKRQDDSPISSSAAKAVQIIQYTSFPYNPNNTNNQQKSEKRIVNLDSDGTKVLTIRPPANSINVRLEAKYDVTGDNQFGQTSLQSSVYVDSAKSPSDSFLQIESLSDSVAAGSTITFNVRGTGAFIAVTAQVMARGQMVSTQQIQLTNNLASIRIPTTAEMAPKARLVVYGVQESNNEIVVDAIDFKVTGVFKNKVSVTISKDQASPGDMVDVTVKADADSFVALLAVDKSVQLYKSGNDITADLVENEIEGYTTQQHGGYGGPWIGRPFNARRAKRSIWFPWWIGGKDAKTIFDNAGILVLTNAYLYSEPLPPMVQFAMMAPGDRMPDMMAAGPPMPQPVGAFGGAVQQQRAAPQVVTRTEFPETWIWIDQVASSNGQAVYTAKVPDTITSWITSAFAVSDDTGLGVAPETATVNVFRPFFIQMNLPYSVKRNEKMALQVLVFNYESTPQTVRLTLDHSSDSGFNFVNRNGTLLDLSTAADNYNKRQTTVPGNGGSVSVFFPIVPTELGDLKLKVTAIGSTTSDAVEKPLLVEPEGFRVDQNRPIVIDLSDQTSFSENVQLIVPPETVSGSKRAEVNVAGDIMGSVLSNLEGLVQMPYGCGEQNMVNFVPNIVVVNYLNATQRSEPQLVNKAIQFMQRGYQRELNYKRNDGSFSAFGQSDEHGSTWLTAFVLRSFKQAQNHIFVDQSVLNSAVEYIVQQQNEKGEFTEIGDVHHEAMQGGASEGGVPMTAYVTLAMLENQVTNNKAITYLENQLPSVADETYALAVTAYALQLANSPKKDEAWNMLVEKAITADGVTHWSDKVNEERTDEDKWYWSGPRSVDVEMTAYALLTLMSRNEVSAGLPIARWLSSMRNQQGGWASTQDTVVALQALAAFAEKAYSPKFNVKINVRNGAASHTFDVTPQNALVWQSWEVEDMDAPVELTATGSGVVFAQVQWRYHMTKLRDDLPFGCDQDVFQSEGSSDLVLSLCCKYKKTGKKKSNMAVLEVNTLSGYQFDLDKLNTLTNIKSLQRVETEKSDSKANMYFNQLTSDPVCINVTSQLSYQVSDQTEATAVLYDYYENADRVEMQYSPRQKRDLNAVCSDCWSNLVTADAPTPGLLNKQSAGVRVSASSTILCALVLSAICLRRH